MTKFPARVIADGRVTIPEALREEHEIDEGDMVVVEVEKYGQSEPFI